MLDVATSVLLVVDLQERFSGAIDRFEDVVARTGILVQACKALQVPVLVSEQYPQGLGPTISAIHDHLPDGTPVFAKSAFGCLGDEPIRTHLASLGRRQVIVCGIEAHVCIHQSVQQLLGAGYETHVIRDATASRDKRDLKTALARMDQAGATLSCVEMALFELLRDAAHPAFKTLRTLL